MPDTPTYIQPGINLIEKGAFAAFDEKGQIQYEILRTPGYPLFLGVLHKVFKLSFDAIIVVQILLITLAGYIIYKAAYESDKNIALLAVFIFLFDLPVTISTLMLLTEGLYTVFLALFMFFFLKYLKEYRIGSLIISTIILALATYIRPVSYYLGICLAIGIIYALFRTNMKKAIAHALILLLIFYASIGAWHYRNYIKTGDADFTIIDDVGFSRGPLHRYATVSAYEQLQMGPLLYYADYVAKTTIQFFAAPGTLKCLGSRPIKIAAKIFGYPWVAFWLLGVFFARYDKLPYRFLLFAVLYFAAVSIVVTGLHVGSRFRVPIMPLLSILSASGWLRMIRYIWRPGSGP